MLLQIQVMLSLVGVITGFVSLAAMLSGRLHAKCTLALLLTTALTSVTGFPLPPFGFDPARIVQLLSLVVLSAAIIGR